MKNLIFSGGIFLFALTVILCMTSFAVLAYSSAENDLMLAEKNEEYVKSYYEADKRAAETIGRIDAILSESKTGAKNKEEYYKSIESRIKETESYIEMNDNILKFSIMVNNTQKMSVELELLDLSDNKRFRIKSYRLDREEIWEETDIEDNIKGMWKGK